LDGCLSGASGMMPPVSGLALHGVEKSWGPRPVLRGVDLAVGPGATAWIGGRNAAGKTTLLRVAAGLVEPDAGRVELGGAAPGDRRARNRRLGWLPPGDRGLYARLTARQNLELAAGLALIPRRAHRAAVAEALDRWALGAEADRRVDRLSMGQRQRVRIAGALLHEPRVLLLDEPHTSLDDEGLRLLATDLARRAADGAAVVWCSPPIDRDRLPADAFHLLDDGRLVAA
jgi:ABC-2 type transport system ATP-binding protein